MSSDGRNSSVRGASPLLALVCLHLAVRLGLLAAKPLGWTSLDIDGWRAVAIEIAAGNNPYVTTPHLNHPPFWAGCIAGLGWLSARTGWPFETCVFALLVLAETALLVLGFAIARRHVGERVAFVSGVLGVTLFPPLLLLTIIHGNFDVFVGMGVLATAGALMAHQSTGRRGTWLLACAAVGFGAFVKLTPIVLVPVLVGFSRRVRWRTRCAGTVLAIGPVVVGLAVIYAMAPAAVMENVFRYRSRSSEFGLTGLLPLWTGMSSDVVVRTVQRGWPVLECVLVGIIAIRAWEGRIQPRLVPVACALPLLAIPTIGPGYAPQYLFWWWPAILLSAAVGSFAWRTTVILAAVIAAATYLVDYAVTFAHGGPLVRWGGVDRASPWMSWLNGNRGQSLMRLPLFGVQLLILIVGLWRVGRGGENLTPAVSAKGREAGAEGRRAEPV